MYVHCGPAYNGSDNGGGGGGYITITNTTYGNLAQNSPTIIWCTRATHTTDTLSSLSQKTLTLYPRAQSFSFAWQIRN